MQAKLIVVGGEVKTTEVKLKLPCVVGRGRGTGLMLPHPLVSRQHCEIYEHEGQLVVRDLGSLNGTYINNTRLSEPTLLPSGDLLTIGTVTFRAEYGDSNGLAAPEPSAQTIQGAAGGATIQRPGKQTPDEDMADFGEVDEVEEHGPPAGDDNLLPPMAEGDLDVMSMFDDQVEELADEPIPDAKPTARADAHDIPVADANETLRDNRQEAAASSAAPEMAPPQADDADFLAGLGLGLAETLRPDDEPRPAEDQGSMAETLLPEYAAEPVAATDDLLADLGLDDLPSETSAPANEAVAEEVAEVDVEDVALADIDLEEIAVVDEFASEEVAIEDVAIEEVVVDDVDIEEVVVEDIAEPISAPAASEDSWAEPPVAERELFEEIADESPAAAVEESPAAESAAEVSEISEPASVPVVELLSDELAVDLPDADFSPVTDEIEEPVEVEEISIVADLEPAAADEDLAPALDSAAEAAIPAVSETAAAEIAPDDFLASLGLDSSPASEAAPPEPSLEQPQAEPTLEAADETTTPVVDDVVDEVLELDEIVLEEINLDDELPLEPIAERGAAEAELQAASEATGWEPTAGEPAPAAAEESFWEPQASATPLELPAVDLPGEEAPFEPVAEDAFAEEMLANLEPAPEEPAAKEADASTQQSEEPAPMELDEVWEMEAVVEEVDSSEPPSAELPGEEVSAASWSPAQPVAASDDDFMNDLMAELDTPSVAPALDPVGESTEEVKPSGDPFTPMFAETDAASSDVKADDVVDDLVLEEIDIVDEVLDIEELPLESSLEMPETIDPLPAVEETPEVDAGLAAVAPSDAPSDDAFVDELLAEMSPETAEADYATNTSPTLSGHSELSEPEFVEEIFAELTPTETPIEEIEIEAVEIEEVLPEAIEELDVLATPAAENDFGATAEASPSAIEPLPFAAPLAPVTPVEATSSAPASPPAVSLPPGSPPLARRPHAAPRPRGTPPGRNPQPTDHQTGLAAPATNGPSIHGPSANGPATNGPATNGPTTTADADADLDAFLKDLGQ